MTIASAPHDHNDFFNQATHPQGKAGNITPTPDAHELEGYHRKEVRTKVGIAVGGVLAAGAAIAGFHFSGATAPDAGVVQPEQHSMTPEQKYQALQLQFVAGDKTVTVKNAAGVLGSLLSNELYAEEHGDDNGYKATFAQIAPNDYGDFAQRVAFDQKVSSTLVAQHATHPNTYPTQSVEIEEVQSVSPANPLDGSVVIGATARYQSNVPNADGSPVEQIETVTGAYTLVKEQIANFSDHKVRTEWVIKALDVTSNSAQAAPTSPTN